MLIRLLFAALLTAAVLVLMRRLRNARRGSGGAPSAPLPDRGEALQILGLKEGATEEEVRAAHRRLLQKLHPDRGGSDYLAKRINAARDRLLQ